MSIRRWSRRRARGADLDKSVDCENAEVGMCLCIVPECQMSFIHGQRNTGSLHQVEIYQLFLVQIIRRLSGSSALLIPLSRVLHPYPPPSSDSAHTMFLMISGNSALTSFPSVIAAIVFRIASFLYQTPCISTCPFTPIRSPFYPFPLHMNRSQIRNRATLPFMSKLRVQSRPQLKCLSLPRGGGEHAPDTVRRHGARCTRFSRIGGPVCS